MGIAVVPPDAADAAVPIWIGDDPGVDRQHGASEILREIPERIEHQFLDLRFMFLIKIFAVAKAVFGQQKHPIERNALKIGHG